MVSGKKQFLPEGSGEQKKEKNVSLSACESNCRIGELVGGQLVAATSTGVQSSG